MPPGPTELTNRQSPFRRRDTGQMRRSVVAEGFRADGHDFSDPQLAGVNTPAFPHARVSARKSISLTAAGESHANPSRRSHSVRQRNVASAAPQRDGSATDKEKPRGRQRRTAEGFKNPKYGPGGHRGHVGRRRFASSSRRDDPVALSSADAPHVLRPARQGAVARCRTAAAAGGHGSQNAPRVRGGAHAHAHAPRREAPGDARRPAADRKQGIAAVRGRPSAASKRGGRARATVGRPSPEKRT